MPITDYLGGFQYRSSYTNAQGDQSEATLQYFPHAEGYVQHVDGEFFYIYNYTDHLGNIRLSYTFDYASGLIKIMEENHYYPFGLKHDSYNTNRLGYSSYIDEEEISHIVLGDMPKFVGDGSYNYKYNGKELQDELGLNMYDYGARNYDPALGRWMNIDPLAEKNSDISTYTYVLNNPLRYDDPDGRIERDKTTGRVKVNVVTKNGRDMVGNGQQDYNVRGNLGYITANDGKTRLPVTQVIYQDNSLVGQKENWVNVSNDETISTNCYGYSIADGDVVIQADNQMVADFLIADGYKEMQTKGYKPLAGDIIMLSEGHVMEIVGIDKNGKAIIESLWAGDVAVKGSLGQINDYYDEMDSSRNSKNTFIFRPTQGDIYVDEKGNKTNGKKVVNEKNKYDAEPLENN